MAVIKCKMCGGDLNLVEGQSVAECEYCGSRQTVPAADNEKKLTLFARANRLRAACEFDKAAGIYETIVADFPEEAEAYWGLVLCKFGIEYVDDPATGNKIPTCHRSSFDSVLDDSNFEQAQENADAVARRVYREEAKQIEELRKGIIAVSSKEEPYDIFICYKETAENGDRTLDSVLAQDIYEALTGKGYRVFFARITLEDKLGQEYEPYIFAALNSAKIMLAVGTDYEYFNAVWVKNEWSRYLKLMVADKSKHLIPCYKNIDAYDMPKEFAKLQAQDLGKVGAMQDLLRGIEKILPKAATMVQEKIVVGGAGGDKIANLLDRGNMALEDGDWAKADSFFEDVLNNDSKNAQAYLGKTLAQERCRTVDAFARKRKDASKNVKGQTLRLEQNKAHVAEMAQKCSVPGYVGEDAIRKLYTYDLSYHSDVTERKQQLDAEASYWTNHKWLSKAEKFATGAVAENIAREKKALFATLDERVKKAEAARDAEITQVRQAYEAHLKQADEKAAQLCQEGQDRREKAYQEWLTVAKNDPNVEKLKMAAEFFEARGDYKDSKALAEHCRKRIADITAEQERLAAEQKAAAEAEAERQRILREKQEAERKAKNKKIAIISAVAVAVVIAVIVVITQVIIPNSKLNKAQKLMDNGEYQQAYDLLQELGEYKNSDALLEEIANHGAYLPVSWTITEDYLDENKTYTYQYDEKGYPFFVTASNENGEKQYEYKFRYTYFENGRLETCTVLRNDTTYKYMEFYDTERNRVEFGEYQSREWQAEQGTNVCGFVFYGVAKRVNYNSDGTVNNTYSFSEEGVSTAYSVTLDEQGRVIHRDDKTDRASYEYIYDKEGTIQQMNYDENGDGDYSDMWDEEYIHNYTYTHSLTGKTLTEWSVQRGESGRAVYKETFGYDENGNVSKHIWWYAADGGLDLGGRDAFVWEWIDFDALVNQMDEYRAEEEAKLSAEYAAAEELLANNQFDEAIEAFEALGAYRDCAERIVEANAEKLVYWYEMGEKLAAEGKNSEAAIAFGKANGYEDAKFQSRELWETVAHRETFSAGEWHTVGLCSDGTAVSAGRGTWGQRAVASWSAIVAVSAGTKHTVGLRHYGTVIAVGDNDERQCNVEEWTDIVAISAGSSHTVGLKMDGTVVAVGYNGAGQCDVEEWTDIIAISAGSGFTVGLKVDGTVVATGSNNYGECDVADWTDIVAISAGDFHTLGLKSDGTVVAVGNNSHGHCNVQDWIDIVAVSAGALHTVGLKSDGTVVAVGYAEYRACNVTSWTDIVAISAAGNQTIGLKSDGTLVAAGIDDYDELQVKKWTDIKVPE